MKTLVLILGLISAVSFAAPKAVVTVVKPTAKQADQVKRDQAFNSQRFGVKIPGVSLTGPVITFVGTPFPADAATGFNVDDEGNVEAK